jgi:hypothetical protein
MAENDHEVTQRNGTGVGTGLFCDRYDAHSPLAPLAGRGPG